MEEGLICGNSLEILPKFESGSVDLVFTDPPYGLKKKGVAGDENLNRFYSILPLCFEVLKNNAFFCTFFSIKRLPEAFKFNPFKYFWQFILYCPNACVQSPIGITKYMTCLVFTKGNPKISKRCKDIFVTTPGRTIEPDEGYIYTSTPKPKYFIKSLIEMFSSEGDLILDPFCGTGSVCIAAKLLRRRFIGIDLNIDEARKRLSQF